MTPFEMSFMRSFEKVGTLYGKSGGTPLCQKFHYKLFFNDPKGLGLRRQCGGY